MLQATNIDGDDSIIGCDKVAEAISQLAISGNHSIDKQSEASIKKTKMGTRWKGKGAEKKALSEPISATMAQLQSSFLQSNTRGILTTTGILLDINDPHQIDLLTRTCLGRPCATSDKDNQWFQLSNEEALYLFYTLKCIKIAENDIIEKNDEEQLLIHMCSNQKNFVNLFKGYCHLRFKNWVVRSGSQYGVDFVAYRHHPSLVHSEYAVIVLSDDDDDDDDANGRLRVWSDVHCTLRLCGSVAKTLLVLNIKKHGKKGVSLGVLESYTIEERTITRWSPELAKEGK